MKARITVYPKPSVLDPQGQAIAQSLRGHGHPQILDVRQGKIFEIELPPEKSRSEAEQEVEAIAHEVLANPVIEEYRVEILD
ncbi:MAG TPA: phosphoribosylformylglycinamidine synthase subunit PurS [Bryobacteraceae bacterium]|jgi:phosphoribosylformylglycinamidine synthase subunit PurS|nr:phosphoribosylformylglycinamidine synthase subunit PurS [Bryobacteraceae bacterium]